MGGGGVEIGWLFEPHGPWLFPIACVGVGVALHASRGIWRVCRSLDRIMDTGSG